MEEPTVAELLRDLQADVQLLLRNQEQYVTREIMELKLASVVRDQVDGEKATADLKARLDSMSRWFWTAVAGPVIVGVVLYFLIGSKP